MDKLEKVFGESRVYVISEAPLLVVSNERRLLTNRTLVTHRRFKNSSDAGFQQRDLLYCITLEKLSSNTSVWRCLSDTQTALLYCSPPLGSGNGPANCTGAVHVSLLISRGCDLGNRHEGAFVRVQCRCSTGRRTSVLYFNVIIKINPWPCHFVDLSVL